ncbi:H(+)-transporting V0 sector ATPase subunit d [Orbilia oligospora]|uniref:V-type proton ATPase subunit D n=2 Tax=Orbilia oligospora TaxID=2813651 RepID=A0A7C8K632_ORBOL|nr:H(+)-transporting V0 sector ATPase subunit d [Orbilia oligospora]KAF3166483.1 H(+)-transporting V0 sector ATPase subunit d [Orbilia oligospora]KAF3234080.1 H(+)-transporting V0 sector ATPase subunit d [Orbilia oligospora]KAF3266598.1 H(+)-transporting V0 sector ATPase subunit d [Orbilia oligospora]KAF3275305.1 H(+)-transporting V0 sector ATPase subunit d [Orbilia oligospora]
MTRRWSEEVAHHGETHLVISTTRPVISAPDQFSAINININHRFNPTSALNTQIMEGLFFNIHSGYVEGIVRGYRNSLLTSSNYSNLTQCETLEDLKLQLTPCYGEQLANVASPFPTSTIAAKATEKLVQDFRYLRAQATGALAKFMDFLTYSYMIDNVALLITGTLHERDTKDLLERCHPLGFFEGLPALCVASNIEELYSIVLVETPLAPFFKDNLRSADLDELNIEIVRNTLYKSYLEAFHDFCTTDPELSGTPSAELMSDILGFEADRRAINITLNSFGTELSKSDRKKLYPEIGKLHPEGTLMLSRADDPEAVRLAIEIVGEYRYFFDQGGIGQGGGGIGGGTQKSLEDIFYQKEMELAKGTFTHHFTFAVVYAWLKLQEQEIRNITWIAECIAQNQKDRIGNYISVF